jgi:hypothetical protein
MRSWPARRRVPRVKIRMSNYRQVSVIPDTEIYSDDLYSDSDYADPSAIRLQTAPQARANKGLRRNRLHRSTSGPFPSATPPTWHLYEEGQRASKISIWKEADAAHLHTQHEFCWRDHIYTNLGVGIMADVISPNS